MLIHLRSAAFVLSYPLHDIPNLLGNDGRMRIFKHEAFFPWVFNFALVLIGFGAKAVVHSVAEIDLIFQQVCNGTVRPVVKFVTMDAGYKTPRIAKKTIEDGRVPVLPYTRYTGRQGRYKPWEYDYDPANDTYTCPRGGILRHTTTDRDGKRTYRSTPEQCRNCPCKAKCGANEK